MSVKEEEVSSRNLFPKNNKKSVKDEKVSFSNSFPENNNESEKNGRLKRRPESSNDDTRDESQRKVIHAVHYMEV